MALVHIAFIITAFLSMEAVAWLAHKYLMHGWLWALHRDHHRKEGGSFFEKNDYFFLIFAIPGIALLALGTFTPYSFLLSLGAGITLYGVTYFIVHDIFIHQRFRWLSHTNNAYFRAVRRAHKMHHKHLGKDDGECFGMLLFPLRYLRAELKRS